MHSLSASSFVIPAEAGIQDSWTPAFAGVTEGIVRPYWRKPARGQPWGERLTFVAHQSASGLPAAAASLLSAAAVACCSRLTKKYVNAAVTRNDVISGTVFQ